MPYATYNDVNALLPEKAQITNTSTPTTTTVTAWIAQAEARLNGALSTAGFSVPATGANDIVMLRGIVAEGVACKAWGVRFPVDETALPKQVEGYCETWKDALKSIKDGTFTLVDQSRRAKTGMIYLGTMQDDD